MKQKLIVLTHKYLDNTGETLNVGGVETIAQCIAETFNQDYQLEIIQLSKVPFQKIIRNQLVTGIPSISKLREYHSIAAKPKGTLTICLTFSWGNWCTKSPTILFQHGIEFDGFYTHRSGLLRKLQIIKASLRNANYKKTALKSVKNALETVCVDLNFINWYRATFPYDTHSRNLTYLPNFAEIPQRALIESKLSSLPRKKGLLVTIARRFEPPRGVLTFATVARRAAQSFPELQFRFLGHGSEEVRLRNLLSGLDNAVIENIPFSKMAHELFLTDISVIPTLWSEGTSLSCIESMANGCAVLSTNVGGLGNLIIDGFNGVLSKPTEEDLLQGLLRLCREPNLRTELARNAFKVAERAFSKQIWIERLKEIIIRHSNNI
jgi:glycosyltransferase involved in cell wall biosynthesis